MFILFSLETSSVCLILLYVCRIVLQQLRLSNRLIAVIGLVMSIVATLLMGDWQAARHDPCTEASLFHHPDLLHTYTLEMNGASSSGGPGAGSGGPGSGSGRPGAWSGGARVSARIECEQLNLSLSLQHHLKKTAVDVYVYPSPVARDGVQYGCEVVDMCQPCYVDTETATCLHLHINSHQHCLERASISPWHPNPSPPLTAYSCTEPHSLFTYCLSSHQIPSASSPAAESDTAFIQDEEEYIATVHLQSVEIIEERVEKLASQHCEEHSSNHHKCRWNPNSEVSHRHCEDCPSICRDRTNYLEFSQFTIAAAILLVSVPVARVPITSIISDIVSTGQQVPTHTD